MWFPVAHSSATMVPFCKIKVTYYWQTFSGCCHLDFQSSTFQVFWYKAYWVVSQHAHWVSGDLKSPAFQFLMKSTLGTSMHWKNLQCPWLWSHFLPLVASRAFAFTSVSYHGNIIKRQLTVLSTRFHGKCTITLWKTPWSLVWVPPNPKLTQ